jgi:hypothetical protein
MSHDRPQNDVALSLKQPVEVNVTRTQYVTGGVGCTVMNELVVGLLSGVDVSPSAPWNH